jgi:hypothetical protein
MDRKDQHYVHQDSLAAADILADAIGAASKHVVRCTACHTACIRVARYDAFACPQCRSWTERTCRDPDCEFCRDRPVSASEVFEANKP